MISKTINTIPQKTTQGILLKTPQTLKVPLERGRPTATVGTVPPDRNSTSKTLPRILRSDAEGLPQNPPRRSGDESRETFFHHAEAFQIPPA